MVKANTNNKKKYTYKKNYKKNYNRYKNASLNFQPSTRLIKHTYVDNRVISGDLGLIASWVIKANGLYDPNSTGIGHQPTFYDELCKLYQHYTVLGSKIEVIFMNTGDPGTLRPVGCGVLLDDDGIFPTTITGLLEQAKQRFPPRIMYNNADSSRADAKVIQKFSAKKFFGLSKPQDNDSITGSTTDPDKYDPKEKAHYIIYAGCMDGASSTGNINITVKVEYIALWGEPTTITQS